MLVMSITFSFVAVALLVYFYVKVRTSFSPDAYAKTMQQEVIKMIRDIRYEADIAVQMLEKKIGECNQVVRTIDRKLTLLNEEILKEHTARTLFRASGAGQETREEVCARPEHRSAPSRAGSSAAKPTPTKRGTIEVYNEKIIRDNGLRAESPLLKDAIIALSEKGLAPEFIAEKTGKPLGEVQLIINLSR